MEGEGNDMIPISTYKSQSKWEVGGVNGSARNVLSQVSHL